MPIHATARRRRELELQARWLAGQFGQHFVTTEGLTVRIVQFGLWNHEAGPDFIHAAAAFGQSAPVCGAIELDLDVRDWERHGHALNPYYNNVILHLFLNRGAPVFFTRTSANRNVPQVQLELADEFPEPLAPLGRCAELLRGLSSREAAGLLERAAKMRLRQKSAHLAKLALQQGADEALYQALAVTLGYKSNKLPFTLLSQRLPLKRLSAQKEGAEALLFGAGGFLVETDLCVFEPETRAYVRKLWEDWWPHRGMLGRLVLAPGDWRISGTRPANHPQRRLAALAAIVGHWPKVRELAKGCEPERIGAFFENLGHPYWSHHYTLGSRRVPKAMALVGAVRVADMLANVFFPYAMAERPELWERYRQLRAPLGNSAVETVAKRLFGQTRPELLKTIVQQQGLLQIHVEFCLRDQSACQKCLFPVQLGQESVGFAEGFGSAN